MGEWSISFRIISLAQGQSQHCPGASDATLNDIDIWTVIHWNRGSEQKWNKAKSVCIFNEKLYSLDTEPPRMYVPVVSSVLWYGVWISNHIHGIQWQAITHSCRSFNRGLVKQKMTWIQKLENVFWCVLHIVQLIKQWSDSSYKYTTVMILNNCTNNWINHWTGPPRIQATVPRPFVAKPLSKSILTNCHMDPP